MVVLLNLVEALEMSSVETQPTVDAWQKVRKTESKPAFTSDQFWDVLDELRDCSDLVWAFRHLQPPSYRGRVDRGGHHAVQRLVLASDRVMHAVRQVAEESNQSIEEVKKAARDIMSEMAHNLNLTSVRSLAYFVGKAMKSLYERIYVNDDGIRALSKAIVEQPVVLLPSHRSYMDFILVSYVCYALELPLPFIAAAMDFSGMRFFGWLLRQCGAFYIRRTFGSDRLYWAIFNEYVQFQLSNGDAPLEFFVEGTRSRTGKSYYPRTGLLATCLEPFLKGEVIDILLVPVSISYDRILEEKLYAYELLGIPKPRESTSGLFSALSSLWTANYGSVRMNFAQPISAREFFIQRHVVDRSVHHLAPRFVATLTPAESKLIEKLAVEVLLSHQRSCVVSPLALVSTVVINELIRWAGRDGRPGRTASADFSISVGTLLEQVVWLKNCALGLGAVVDWDASVNPLLVVEKTLSSNDHVFRVDSSAEEPSPSFSPTAPGEDNHPLAEGPSEDQSDAMEAGKNVAAATVLAVAKLKEAHRGEQQRLRDIVCIKDISLTAAQAPMPRARLDGDPSQEKADQQERLIRQFAAPYLLLSIYRNASLHHFVHGGFICLAVNFYCNSSRLSTDFLFDQYQFLRTLFSREFIFARHNTTSELKAEFSRTLDALISCGAVVAADAADDDVLSATSVAVVDPRQSLQRRYSRFLVELFSPFLLGYLAVCQYLISIPADVTGHPLPCLPAQLKRDTQKRIFSRVGRDGDLPLVFDAISLDLINNALNSLLSLGYLRRSRRGAASYVNPEPQLLVGLASRLAGFADTATTTVLPTASTAAAVSKL